MYHIVFVDMEELTVIDMEAAQQLVQLSGGEEEDEEGEELEKNKTKRKNKVSKDEKEKEGETSKDESLGRMKEEDGDEQLLRSGRRKRFRSLAAIYEETKAAVGDRDEEDRIKKRVRSEKWWQGLLLLSQIKHIERE